MSSHNPIKCFYHGSDFDGRCSGAIVKKEYPDCEMIPMVYDDEFPWDTIMEDDLVYMVDFGLQPFEDMCKLNNICNLVWIDHHQTAIDAMEESNTYFHGIQKSGHSACYHVWNWFYPDCEMPIGVKLLAEFDVWDHSDDRTIPFQFGMKLLGETHPGKSMKIWNEILDTSSNSLSVRIWNKVFGCNPSTPFIDNIVKRGEVIVNYNENDCKSKCTNTFETTFGGYRVIALNHPSPNSSLIFDSVWDEDKYDIMIPFYRSNKGLWCFSLYTTKDDVDCGELAKQYGGGGHAQASGFSSDHIPFKF